MSAVATPTPAPKSATTVASSVKPVAETAAPETTTPVSPTVVKKVRGPFAQANPVYVDDKGQFSKHGLGRRDFIIGDDGRVAFCDYQIALWTYRKTNARLAKDPLAKLQSKRDRIMQQIAELEAQMQKEAAAASAKK